MDWSLSSRLLTSQAVVTVDPGGVPADGDMAYLHLWLLLVTAGAYGDRNNNLINIRPYAAGNLQQGASSPVSECKAGHV